MFSPSGRPRPPNVRQAGRRSTSFPFVVLSQAIKEGEVQYMLLIYGDQSSLDNRSEEERGKMYQAYGTFTQELRDSGAMIAGDALEPTQTLTTDGPFAETKEQLGGYYLIEADSLDEAIEWAAKIPGARHGSVEVRPVMVFEGNGS
jgi:hypothetical protein